MNRVSTVVKFKLMPTNNISVAKERLIIFILAAIQFTHLVDFMVIMPLGKQFMEVFSISPQQFSLIVTAYALAACLSGLFGAAFIDRFDRKMVVLSIYIGFTIGTFACAFAPNYHLFLAARAFTGAFGGIIGALVLSIIGDIVPLERRGAAMGIVMTSFSAASVAGIPLGLWLAATWGWRTPFLVLGFCSFFITLLMLYYLPALRQHLEGEYEAPNLWKVYKLVLNDANQLRALLFSMLLMLGHFTVVPFLAPYMQLNIGFSDYDISYIYITGGLMTIVFLPIIGRLSDRYGHAFVFTIASFFALCSIYVVTNLEEAPIWIILCLTASFFIAASGRFVPATTMMTSVVKAENRGSFMSIRSSVNELAFAIASFIAGLIVVENDTGKLEHFHYVGYLAIFMSILAVLLARTLKLGKK